MFCNECSNMPKLPVLSFTPTHPLLSLLLYTPAHFMLFVGAWVCFNTRASGTLSIRSACQLHLLHCTWTFSNRSMHRDLLYISGHTLCNSCIPSFKLNFSIEIGPFVCTCMWCRMFNNLSRALSPNASTYQSFRDVPPMPTATTASISNRRRCAFRVLIPVSSIAAMMLEQA